MARLPEFLSIAPAATGRDTDWLLRRIHAKRAFVGVIGQGYVGFPLAQRIAHCGFTTVGYDINSETLQRCTATNGSHRYRATSSAEALATCVVIIIAVPTPTIVEGSRRRPDLSLVLTAVANTLSLLRVNRPKLIVVESTYAPGTTRRQVAPLIAEQYRLGQDVFLGYSPERIDPGNASYDVANTPKITSGYDATSAELTQEFYSRVVSRAIPASSMEAAEATKMLENTFRFISITFAQEFDEYCASAGLDAREVTDLAATKPFGFMPFFAGAGIGGHCIAEDPYYLEESMDERGASADILRAALRNHESRAGVIVRRICAAAGGTLQGARVLLLGVSYKPNIGDARQSPATGLVNALEAVGATVDYHDPYVRTFANRRSIDLMAARPFDYDVAAIITPHDDFDLDAMELDGWPLFDTRRTPPLAPAAMVGPVNEQLETADLAPKRMREAARSR